MRFLCNFVIELLLKLQFCNDIIIKVSQIRLFHEENLHESAVKSGFINKYIKKGRADNGNSNDKIRNSQNGKISYQ